MNSPLHPQSVSEKVQFLPKSDEQRLPPIHDQKVPIKPSHVKSGTRPPNRTLVGAGSRRRSTVIGGHAWLRQGQDKIES